MTADELQVRVRAFRESRVLLTAIELDVCNALGDGADTAAVARKIGADVRATEMLLNALTAMEVLTKREGVFRNTPLAEKELCGDARNALLHAVNLWPRWSALTECVRTGKAVAHQPLGNRSEDWTASFIAAMHSHARERAPLAARALGAESVRRMLDLGGGSGAYSIAFAQANPELEAVILDLPTVVPIARGHIERAGLAKRITAKAGDLTQASYGEGFDLVWLSSICHMLGPQENRAMLRKAFQALAPRGRVAILDFVLSPDKTSPPEAALFSLNMLTGTAEGSSYSESEYAEWLGEAGFQDIKGLQLAGPSSMIIGTRR